MNLVAIPAPTSFQSLWVRSTKAPITPEIPKMGDREPPKSLGIHNNVLVELSFGRINSSTPNNAER